MTFHSETLLDCIGFRRSDILPLLAAAGIVSDNQIPLLPPANEHHDWPAWKLRLAAADYLTDAEAGSALAGLDPSAPGYLPDDEAAEQWHWQDIIKRACLSGTLKADVGSQNERGHPQSWEITPAALAAWCASKTPQIPYPLPGTPLATMPGTDADLRDALIACERERDTWMAKAETLVQEAGAHADLKAENVRLRDELLEKSRDVASLRMERDALKGDAPEGKSRKTFLKIIGGMAKGFYGMDIHASRLDGIDAIMKDLELAGAAVGLKTLSALIKESATVIDKDEKRK